MRTVNLGILAHVDAGKTSLTERLLFAAGVIDEIGSVDDGNTQTDSLALERQRGITIKAAVVSFAIQDVTVNLIDTPGHPDFIAEVERVLSVLDGAVLVVSAVEGIQAQTRVLMRTLQRLTIPTLIFVNKIDRGGAQPERVFDDIAAKLTPNVVAMSVAHEAGSKRAISAPLGARDPAFAERLVDCLAEHDEALLAAYLEDESQVTYERLRSALAKQTARALVHPVYFGSAITGAGVEALMAGISGLLPAVEGAPDAAPAGVVFKVERGPDGERVAYVRLFAGTVRTRDRLHFRSVDGRPDLDDEHTSSGERSHADPGRKVTALRVFEHGTSSQRPSVSAGQIARLWGLGDVRIGDTLGEVRARSEHHFAPPTLESVIVPRQEADRNALHVALTQLAEQDPLINLRQDDARHEISVSLYGEVQKEVIQATLADLYSIEVEFRDTTTICVERPAGTGAAIALLGAGGNPFCATVGLRVEPGPPDSGIRFSLDAELTSLPLYIYKSVGELRRALEETVRETLQQGLLGWRVVDCTVTMTDSGYISPVSTAGDFRKLTPLVLMAALQQAGTEVCEPIHRYRLELPADTFGAVAPLLARLRAVTDQQASSGAVYILEGSIPVARVHELQQRIPGLTHGEGVLECTFSHYDPVAGTPPVRPRTDLNPLNRKEYLMHLGRRV